ncbi:hypothetical protein [Nocardioides antri]|uniref:Uncharacterized protein n=1 Tax=Nocardioides antri TaxID=2607659 RepID=A0A5B1LW08_9ACTN|nr:hypothetical protein [Nocardioides antri]KAA1424338.1 hypothetical protein F0U47_19080 [Nocardioides antri]
MVGRALAAAATTIGLTVAVTGCGSNVIGADGPQPGLAAQVEDSEITLDELDQVTDGLCTIQEADPQAIGTSRAYARSQILQAWVRSLVSAAYAEEHDLDVPTPDARLEQAPGWEDVDEEDQDALRDYVDAFSYSESVLSEAEGERPDPADYDIVINPRFDVELDGEEFVPAEEQLSVPVSDEAAGSDEPPSAEALQDLTDDELCGKRPDPQPAAPIPMG